MKIVRLSKNSNLNRIDKVFKWFRFSGRGPQGEQGDTGAAGANGGIDYANPIPVDTSQTITPTNGQYFTTTAKLIELSGTAGEVFEPAQAGETSRRIWGLGSGLALINVPIDTSSLGVGEVFAFEADNGESRIMRLNSVGDLIRIGGVEIPMKFRASLSANQSLSLTTWDTVGLDVVDINDGDVFDAANHYFQPKRTATWEISGMYSGSSNDAINRATSRLIIDPSAVLSDFLGDVYPDAASTTGKTIRSPGAPVLRRFTTADQVFLGLFLDATGSSGLAAFGGSNSGECRMSGVEVPPW